MHEANGLIANRRRNGRVTVSGVCDAECRGEIDVAVTVNVRDRCAERGFPKNGETFVDERDVARFKRLQPGRQFARTWAGYCGAQFFQVVLREGWSFHVLSIHLMNSAMRGRPP